MAKPMRVLVLLAALLLAGCTPTQPAATAPTTAATAADAPAATVTAALPPAQPTTKPTIPVTPPTQAAQTPSPEAKRPSKAAPQPVDFTTEDGVQLQGLYYPAAVSPAPLVVLMHQYTYDQHQWDAVAPWLQNRPGELTSWQDVPAGFQPQGKSPWLDASWFPPVPADLKVAVFTFTFRECEGGCKVELRSEWLRDALAAVEKAASLPGVDATKIILVGTSIGADGAADTCLLFNKDRGGCLGALSVSPGGYLTLPFENTARELTRMGVPVQCFASKSDRPAAAACGSMSGDNYRATILPGAAHGTQMIDPALETTPLHALLQLLGQVLNP